MTQTATQTAEPTMVKRYRTNPPPKKSVEGPQNARLLEIYEKHFSGMGKYDFYEHIAGLLPQTSPSAVRAWMSHTDSCNFRPIDLNALELIELRLGLKNLDVAGV